MPVRSTFDVVAEGLNVAGIRFLLVGGYACQAYGVSRSTMDFDIAVREEDAEGVNRVLTAAGYARKVQTGSFARYRHESVWLMDVDVLHLTRATMEKLEKEARTRRTGTREFQVPSVAHLVAMKLHAIRNNAEREKRDVEAIAQLLTVNPGAVSPEETRELCERFGPPGIWEILKDCVKWTT
jgi:hypothetical protein